MAYTFRVTAKRDIAANGQRIGKGMVVQVCTLGCSPGAKDILAAFKQQLGIEIKGTIVSTSSFNIEKLK